MKTSLTVILSALILNTGYAQTNKNPNTKWIDFINSFEVERNDDILKFGRVIQRNNRMSKEEALDFVYHSSDTSRLYCDAYYYSMETEKVYGSYRELYLPHKIFRIDRENYSLIGYTSFTCRGQDSDESNVEFLHLAIISKDFELRDSMIVYEGTEHSSMITGLLNPKNGKIFIQTETEACIYTINSASLKFEKTRESKETVQNDNLIECLETLNWKDFFPE